MEGGVYSRIVLVTAAELPRLGEGGESAQVVGLVLAHQFALHFLWWTDHTGGPVEGAGTALRLR